MQRAFSGPRPHVCSEQGHGIQVVNVIRQTRPLLYPSLCPECLHDISQEVGQISRI